MNWMYWRTSTRYECPVFVTFYVWCIGSLISFPEECFFDDFAHVLEGISVVDWCNVDFMSECGNCKYLKKGWKWWNIVLRVFTSNSLVFVLSSWRLQEPLLQLLFTFFENLIFYSHSLFREIQKNDIKIITDAKVHSSNFIAIARKPSHFVTLTEWLW